MRVERETAPRSRNSRETAPVPSRETTPESPRQPTRPQPPEQHEAPLTPGSSVSSLLRPQRQTTQPPGQPQLFPSANRMAKLEDTYRHKFEDEVAEGDTKFLNSNDIQFGSFLRRFETSVYAVWRYPSEAASKGIEGITPVKITFNKRGEIVHVQLLESSGSKILDDEVLRTLKDVGPVGALPKGYAKEEFNLIAFFQYGGARRSLR
jgi:protein TonB